MPIRDTERRRAARAARDSRRRLEEPDAVRAADVGRQTRARRAKQRRRVEAIPAGASEAELIEHWNAAVPVPRASRSLSTKELATFKFDGERVGLDVVLERRDRVESLTRRRFNPHHDDIDPDLQERRAIAGAALDELEHRRTTWPQIAGGLVKTSSTNPRR